MPIGSAAGYGGPGGGSEPSEVLGLTQPVNRGHSRGFIIEVIVELGFASREAVGRRSRHRGRSGESPEAQLVGQGAITPSSWPARSPSAMAWTTSTSPPTRWTSVPPRSSR